MATKETTKGIRASRSGVSLHVSHGSKVTAPKPSARKVAAAPGPTGALPQPPAKQSVPPRSIPPRAKRPARTAPVAGDAGQLAIAIAGAALEKKAGNVEIIDLGGKADYADYLVLMTGSSDRHVRALADGIQDSLNQQRRRPLSVEGQAGGSWILIDFGTVVAHVFQENVRALYDIEGLWLDAARVPVTAGR